MSSPAYIEAVPSTHNNEARPGFIDRIADSRFGPWVPGAAAFTMLGFLVGGAVLMASTEPRQSTSLSVTANCPTDATLQSKNAQLAYDSANTATVDLVCEDSQGATSTPANPRVIAAASLADACKMSGVMRVTITETMGDQQPTNPVSTSFTTFSGVHSLQMTLTPPSESAITAIAAASAC